MVNIGKYSDIVTLWNIVEDITMKYIDQTLQVFYFTFFVISLVLINLHTSSFKCIYFTYLTKLQKLWNWNLLSSVHMQSHRKLFHGRGSEQKCRPSWLADDLSKNVSHHGWPMTKKIKIIMAKNMAKKITHFTIQFCSKTLFILWTSTHSILWKTYSSNTAKITYLLYIFYALRDLVPFVQFKNVKNTHGGVLLLVKLQALSL